MRELLEKLLAISLDSRRILVGIYLQKSLEEHLIKLLGELLNVFLEPCLIWSKKSSNDQKFSLGGIPRGIL